MKELWEDYAYTINVPLLPFLEKSWSYYREAEDRAVCPPVPRMSTCVSGKWNGQGTGEVRPLATKFVYAGKRLDYVPQPWVGQLDFREELGAARFDFFSSHLNLIKIFGISRTLLVCLPVLVWEASDNRIRSAEWRDRGTDTAGVVLRM